MRNFWHRLLRDARFSALQRAENSSIPSIRAPSVTPIASFSALQRAENSSMLVLGCGWLRPSCFSALQRAENSSIRFWPSTTVRVPRFQCSSASRKFLNCWGCVRFSALPRVSVLFSEPKIPQSALDRALLLDIASFSALQRAENSSIHIALEHALFAPSFQCSSASRKFLNLVDAHRVGQLRRFQCSSASRKFLNPSGRGSSSGCDSVSVLFSEPKIPQ